MVTKNDQAAINLDKLERSAKVFRDLRAFHPGHFQQLKNFANDVLNLVDAERASPVAAPEAPTAWHDAVLTECMRVDGCYHAADPVKTLKQLLDWHVQNERDIGGNILAVERANFVCKSCASTGAAPEAPATEPSLVELESKVAAARADATLFNDEAMRLRRVVRALGMEREVPEDDATLRGCLFAVLGQIAYKLERATSAATTASASDWQGLPPIGERESIQDVCGLPKLMRDILEAKGSPDSLGKLYDFIDAWGDARFEFGRATAPSRNAAPLVKVLAALEELAKGAEIAKSEEWVNERASVVLASLTQQSAAQAPSRDSERLDYIERNAVRGGTYKGVTSIDVIVHSDELAKGVRYAIDRMKERDLAATEKKEQK